MFSKTCEYAIRAMIFIAQRSKGGEKAGIKEISKEIDSPESFIAKILQELSRKGLVLSSKGPNGGFYLDDKLMDGTLAAIVKAVDGEKIFSGCGLGLKQCSEAQPCPIHYEFKAIRENMRQLLEQARLGSFTAELEKKLTFLKRG